MGRLRRHQVNFVKARIRMIKTISYWSMQKGIEGTHPIEEALDDARREGFAALELCIAPQGAFHVEMSQSQCQDMRRQADDKGVIVQTVASGMSWAVNPSSEDRATREKSIEIHAAALQRTAWVGASAITFY